MGLQAIALKPERYREGLLTLRILTLRLQLVLGDQPKPTTAVLTLHYISVEPSQRVELCPASYQDAVLTVSTNKAGTSCENRTHVTRLKGALPNH